MSKENKLETNQKAKMLEEEYMKFFSPPPTYNKDEFFEQVSFYDETMPVYTSDSTVEEKNA